MTAVTSCRLQAAGQRKRWHRGYRQNGFSLVTAIFLIVVLGALGAYLVTISGVQHTTVAMGIQGARAYQAARAGIEWGTYQALNTAPGTVCNTTPIQTTFALTSGAFNGFSVVVTCQFTTQQERLATYNVYVITSFASYGALGTLDFASRRLQATITDAP